MGRRSTVRTGAGGGKTAQKNNRFFDRVERLGRADRERAGGQTDPAALPPRQAPERAYPNGPGGPDARGPVRAGQRSPIPAAPRDGAPAALTGAAAGAVPPVATAAAGTAEAVRAALGSWGWLPGIVFIAAVGLISVGSAMQTALDEKPGAQGLLWLGLLLIFAPVAFRMALPQAPRRERIALAIWLGLALYLVKILRSPAGFTFHDEFPHYSTAEMILRTQHLFGPNSLQGVSAYFPGLEIATSALAAVGGMSIEAAGLIVIGAARLIASLATYLLYEEISGSPRVAGIGSVLAIAYPNYIFWSSQYSYESLALPLAVLVLLVGLLKGRRSAPRTGLTILALVLVAAVTLTHHVTSYFLAVSLVAVWVFTRFGQPVIGWIERLPRRLPRLVTRVLHRLLHRLLPHTLWTRPTEHVTRTRDWAPLAAGAAGFVALWLLIVGREIASYLEPHLARAVAGFVGVVSRSGSARQPFSSNTATTAAPPIEQLVAFGAVLLILVVIPFGLIQIWRRYRNHGVALLFAVATIAYPFTLVLRLAGGGAEIANRSWDFLFVAYGFVLAVGIAELWMAHTHPFPRAGVFAAYASVLLAGALIVGSPAWARLPGPFLVGGDTRGLQPESYALTNWMRDRLGPDNRIIADYSNKLLLGSFGEQYSVTGLSWVYISPKLSANGELADLVKRGVQYVVVDDRLTTQTPRIGHYFEPGEPDSPWREPLPAADLAKFDRAQCLSRVFDSGHITVYAVSPSCAPGVVPHAQLANPEGGP